MATGLRLSLLSVLLGVAAVSYFSFLGLYWLMWKLANKRLPAEGRIRLWKVGRLRWMPKTYRYIDPFAGWSRTSREYRCLYPGSRIYPLAVGFLIAFLVCAVAIFCVRFTQIAMGK